MKKIFLIIIIFTIFLAYPRSVLAMPVGTLLFRTSNDGQMYGLGNKLLNFSGGILKNIYSGHVGIYVGREDGVDYVVEALGEGIIKTPAKYFINEAAGEKLIGAKIPISASPAQRARAALIAKNIANSRAAYDFDFRTQKGPDSGEWICSGLAEKVYESANITNPYNLSSLEYDPKFYAVNITPDGFDYSTVVNDEGDCLSKKYEFSKIARRTKGFIPAPEILGYDLGLEKGGNRYLFLPYTQFAQSSLQEVEVDIDLSSSFQDEEIRGSSPVLALLLRWGLINNPLSSVRQVAAKIKKALFVSRVEEFPLDDQADIASSGDITVDSSDSLLEEQSSLEQATSSLTFEDLVKKFATNTPVSSEKTESAKSSKNSQKKIETNAIKATSSKSKIVATSTKEKPPIVKKEDNQKVTKSSPPASSAKVVYQKNETIKATITPVYYQATSSNKVENQQSSSGGSSATQPVVNHPPNQSTSTANQDINQSSSTPILPLLISRVFYSTSSNWLELFNPNDSPVDLASLGYRLEKAKTAKDPSIMIRFASPEDVEYKSGSIIAPFSSYLVVASSSINQWRSLASAIATRDDFSWGKDGYTIYLAKDAISTPDDQDILDKIGFGLSALYFEGSPAEVLKDNYLLERKAFATSTLITMAPGGFHFSAGFAYDSNDNSFDFLLRSWDYSFDSASSSTATSTPSFEGAAISSPGIEHLWHFDECYGESADDILSNAKINAPDLVWRPGKFGCALRLRMQEPVRLIKLPRVLDTKHFSLSFYYQEDPTNPRLEFAFFREGNPYRFSITIDPYFTEFTGLAGEDYRDRAVIKNDTAWHLFVLTVSGEDFRLYDDGQEVYSGLLSTDRPNFNSLELSVGSGHLMVIDELALWERTLDVSEILDIYRFALPFEPLSSPLPDNPVSLAYSWNFLSSGTPLTLHYQDATKFFALGEEFSAKDFSFTFWWKEEAYPNDSRPLVSFYHNEDLLAGIMPSRFTGKLIFNKQEEYLAGDLVPANNNWHFSVFAYDAHNFLLKIFIDGEEKLNRSYLWLPDSFNQLGLRAENYPFSISKAELFVGALTAERVEEIFSQGPPE